MISVCLATYNGEKYIRDQVESILCQLKKDDELIISDDGSTDSTIEILEAFHDPRIKIFHNMINHGVNGNFENALRNTKGDYIFLSDQDDIWLTGKVDACLDALKDSDCVIHDAIVVDENLVITCNSFFKERNSGSGFWKNLYKNTYLGCCMAFRSCILDLCLPIPITKSYYHDNWIGCISDLKFNIKFIPYKGIYFRRHSSNTSCTARKSNFSKYNQILHRIIQFKDVVKRILFK